LFPSSGDPRIFFGNAFSHLAEILADLLADGGAV